jgi:hypothetical protein
VGEHALHVAAGAARAEGGGGERQRIQRLLEGPDLEAERPSSTSISSRSASSAAPPPAMALRPSRSSP